MINKYIILFLLILSSNYYCQENTESIFNTIMSDAEIFVEDGYSFYTAPLRMNESEWLTITGVSIGTYFLIQNDDNLRLKFGTEVEKYKTDFWKSIEYFGVVQFAEIAGAATYGVGLFSNNKEIRTVGRMLMQSLTYSGLTAMFIRMIAGRKRPSVTDDPLKFIGFTANNNYQSFPSGHVTVAFTISTVLAEYFNTPLSRVGFYSLGLLSATERLINSQHWFTDVALGALVGIAGGIHVINEEAKRNSGTKSKLSIKPTFNGISLQYNLN